MPHTSKYLGHCRELLKHALGTLFKSSGALRTRNVSTFFKTHKHAAKTYFSGCSRILLVWGFVSHQPWVSLCIGVLRERAPWANLRLRHGKWWPWVVRHMLHTRICLEYCRKRLKHASVHRFLNTKRVFSNLKAPKPSGGFFPAIPQKVSET
jgi:hypothetical protein